jgi:catechol 2,3-dioxygenase-like lactoylglutathione lyase family enzyme
MLNDSSTFPVLPAADLARATAFYRETLGLTVAFEAEGGVAFTAGNGTMLFIYPHGATKAEHTVAGFMVDDLDSTVAGLRAKGVAFEEYDMPGLKTVDGIADAGGTKAAWFKDSEGNILSIGSLPA